MSLQGASSDRHCHLPVICTESEASQGSLTLQLFFDDSRTKSPFVWLVVMEEYLPFLQFLKLFKGGGRGVKPMFIKRCKFVKDLWHKIDHQGWHSWSVFTKKSAHFIL